jgi:hypothetical protein
VSPLGGGLTSAASSVAANGDVVHAVYWRQFAAGNEEVFYRRSQNRGDSWEPEVRLTDATGLSRSPSVAVSGSTVYVVWADDRAGNFEIYLKLSQNGGTTWGTDTRLTTMAGSSLGPSVAVSASRIHVVWNDDRDGNLEIYHKRGALDGSSWDADARITNTGTSSTHPTLAIGSSAVHLAWEEGQQVAYQLSLDDGATWSAAQQLSHALAGQFIAARLPSIAATDQDVHVVWMDNRTLTCIYCYRLYYASSTSNGSTWGGEREISSDESSTGYPSLSASGSALRVLWASRSEIAGTSIYYLRSLDGGQTWGARTTITDYAGNVDRPSHSFADGRLHMVWTKDAYDPNSTVQYANLDEGADLDVHNARLDVVGNVMRMRPTTTGTVGARLWVGQFVVGNTDAGFNPDPDGPSEAPALDQVQARGLLNPRPPAQILLDLQQCLSLAGMPGTPSPGPNQALTLIDLIRGTSRLPAMLVVPSSLNRGAPRRGEVIACVRTSATSGIYEQRVVVTGRAGANTTLDSFRVRLTKPRFVWPPF